MEYVTMAEGLEFSRVVLGFWRLLDWNLSTDELIRYLEECLDLGITTMDHADIYGDYTVEEKFGEAMKKRPDLRDEMQIISKCGIVYKSEFSAGRIPPAEILSHCTFDHESDRTFSAQDGKYGKRSHESLPGREDSSYALVSACRRQDLYRAGRRGNKAQRSFRSHPGGDRCGRYR